MSAHLRLANSHPPRTVADGPVLAFDPAAPHPHRPRLRCGWPGRLSPHVDDAHAHAHAWVVRMGLVGATEAALQRCLAARFAWLAGRAYPTVDREGLHVVVDWLSFLFFYDDLCDTRAVQDGVYRGDLAELEARLITPATYARLRALNSAVFPCLDLAGMFIDGDDRSFAQATWLQQLELMANNHVSWVNDVYGIDKEIREGTHANLVVVLAHDHGMPWDDALDRAIEACNAELDAFFALAEIAREQCDARGHAFIEAMASWMRGNLDWYTETARYGLGP